MCIRDSSLDEQRDWQRYVERHILTIARENGIKAENLAWACAAHGERDHPHVHIVFWDKSARVRNPYTPPEVPNRIRRQLIKETFSAQIKEYGAAKDQAVTDLRAVSDALVDEFERSVRGMSKAQYAALRSLYDCEEEDSESGAAPESLLDDFADRLFKIKAAIPPKGRVAYKLLPPEVKAQVDELVAFLLSQDVYKRQLGVYQKRLLSAAGQRGHHSVLYLQLRRANAARGTLRPVSTMQLYTHAGKRRHGKRVLCLYVPEWRR